MIRSIFRRPLLVLGLAAVLASINPVLAARWADYHNPLYDYSASYPADIFPDAEASPSGAGVALRSNDGAALLLFFAGGNALEHDPGTMANDLGGLDDVREVTYRRVGKNWFVLSGYLDRPDAGEPVIFYERVEFSPDRSAISGFRLEYPDRMRARIDDLIGPIGRSLTPPGRNPPR